MTLSHDERALRSNQGFRNARSPDNDYQSHPDCSPQKTMARNIEMMDVTATRWFTVMKNRSDLGASHNNHLKDALSKKFTRDRE